MKNINTKSIIFGLGTLAIFAFGLITIPTPAKADYVYTNGYVGYVRPIPKPTPAIEVNNPKPNVSSISPKSSNVGVGTKTITINGSGFVPSSIARVNGSNRSTTFIDSSHLLVQLNGNDIYTYRTNGGFFITVWNVSPGGGYSNSAFFTVNNAAVSPVTSTSNNTNNSPDTFTETSQTTVNTTNNNDTKSNSSNLASSAIFGSNSFLPSGLIQWIIFAIIILVIVIFVRKIFGGRQEYEESPMKHA